MFLLESNKRHREAIKLFTVCSFVIDIKEDKGQGWNGLIILPFDFISRNYKKNCSSHCVKFLKVDVEKKGVG